MTRLLTRIYRAAAAYMRKPLPVPCAYETSGYIFINPIHVGNASDGMVVGDFGHKAIIPDRDCPAWRTPTRKEAAMEAWRNA